MAVNIDNATFGYDSNQLQKAINNLNVRCITATIASIKTGLSELRGAVDDAWQGQSAEKFKTKMQEDADEIVKSLEEAGDALETSLKSYVSALADVDNNITF